MARPQPEKITKVYMVAYTNYAIDARVRREAETLAALPEYRVTILVNKLNDKPRHYVLENVNVVELNVPKYRGNSGISYLLSYLHFVLLAFTACTRLFLRGSLDVVHVHNMPNCLVLAAIIPRLFGKGLILDVHDTLVELYACKFGCRALKDRILEGALHVEEYLSCLIAHKVICVNHVQRNALTRRGVDLAKITVILNVPDPKIFPYNTKAHENGSAYFNLVYFGTLANRLGIDLAIKAVAHLADKVPNIRFHIIGEGDQKEELRALSERLGVEKAVHYAGAIRLEELPNYLKDMDLTIIPNRRNSATELMLPVKMLESIAMGIPVATARLNTIEYYFNDEMVFFFEPENVSSLQSTILEAINSPSLRLQKRDNARAFLKPYGWDSHKFALLGLYKSLRP
jgi:glycosyltransferase involved in cell wall biosynthesis